MILHPLTLLIDTETSGLPKDGVALSDPGSPHIIEMAAKMVDASDDTAAEFSMIIRPNGWAVEAAAAAVHGISEARAHRVGVPIETPLVALQAFVEKATEIVIFNAEFDRRMITSEIVRCGGNGRWWTAAAGRLKCAMETASPIMRLPGKFDDWKFPTLDEAHRFFCPEVEWTSGHRALDDLNATLRVWRAIQRRAA